MKLKITIESNIYDIVSIEKNYNMNITIRVFLKDLYDENYKCCDEQLTDDIMISRFSFINNGKRQKAILNYKLKEFLNNFDYDFNNLKMEYLDGTGAGFGFCGFAIIRLNNGESHQPHVHIYPQSKDNFARIDLNTLTQMRGDAMTFNELFKNKERKKILDFLKENQMELIDLYNKFNKGELIMKEYILTFKDKKYVTYSNSKFNK